MKMGKPLFERRKAYAKLPIYLQRKADLSARQLCTNRRWIRPPGLLFLEQTREGDSLASLGSLTSFPDRLSGTLRFAQETSKADSAKTAVRMTHRQPYGFAGDDDIESSREYPPPKTIGSVKRETGSRQVSKFPRQLTLLVLFLCLCRAGCRRSHFAKDLAKIQADPQSIEVSVGYL